MQTKKSYDVFISYRRADGWVPARLLYEKLTDMGLSVFLDVECIGNVNFCTEIEKAIETSTYFISVLSSSAASQSASADRCKNDDDMVRKEIVHAYQHKTEDKIITCTFSHFSFPKDLPADMQTHIMKNAVEFNEILHFKFDLQKLFKFMPEIKIDLSKAYQDRTSNEFYGKENQTVEFGRLSDQDKLQERTWNHIYNKVYAQYNEKIDVLDVGCSNGVKTFGCFGNSKVKSIFGIDINQQSIDEARNNAKEYIEKGIECNFECLNLDDSDLEQKLAKLFKDRKFHLIHLSFVLLHVKDAKKVLKALGDYLYDNGTIMVIEVDDGLNICYPDKNEEYAKFDAFGHLVPELSGNRWTGRAIYTHLFNTYYTDISLEKSLNTNIGYSRKERDQLFEAWNSWIKDRIRLAHEKFPNNKKIADAKEWIDKKYDDMKQKFLSEDFFYGCGTMIFLAHKPK